MAHYTKKKKTIGEANPITEYLQGGSKKTDAHAASYEMAKHAPQAAPQGPKKQRVTIHIDVDLIDRVKNAVYWEPGLTLTDFAQTAFEKQLKKMETAWGDVYPKRKHQLKGGRPMV
jgi:uncharacterized protein (DUF4415 family)